MQSLIFLAMGVFFASINCSEAALSQEQIQAMMNVLSECAGKVGATQNDVEDIIAHRLPTTKEGKCLHACIAEQFGLYKNNKLNVDGAVEMGKMKFADDPSKIELVREIANECASITDPDRCESAAKISKCVFDAATARGSKFYV